MEARIILEKKLTLDCQRSIIFFPFAWGDLESPLIVVQCVLRRVGLAMATRSGIVYKEPEEVGARSEETRTSWLCAAVAPEAGTSEELSVGQENSVMALPAGDTPILSMECRLNQDQPVLADDPFTRKTDMPALPPKRSVHPRPKPPSGKTTPVSMTATADPSKPFDPFQPLSSDVMDPFQNKKGHGDPFSGKDPFNPSSASRPDKVKLGNEAQQLEWAKRESERAERERLKRLRQQEQEDLELAIALSKAEMSNA
ncbi:hypothetical protein CRENBAI_008127 [Crenichthys baileyi]|uniref:Epidermal growth factor receptor substrate 15-like 1 n=1 Tax=Crenichthys baileyi TaxID=28760 RepID=A0AAV9R8Z1_9TELE